MTEINKQAAVRERKCGKAGHGASDDRKPDPFMIKTAISAVLLCMVFAIKSFGGEKFDYITSVLGSYLGNGADYMQAIEVIGNALMQDGDIGSLADSEAIRVFGINLINPAADEEGSHNDSLPEKDDKNEQPDENKGEPETYDADHSQYEEDTEVIGYSSKTIGEIIDEDGYDGEDEDLSSIMPPSFEELISTGGGEPYVISNSAMLADLSILSEEMVIDNTPATEFEIPAPDKVDTAIHKLPFKYSAPVKGQITSPFGYRTHPITKKVTFHYGVDISANSGDRISSFADGTVTETGFGTVNGNYIIVTHEDGYWTRYCHLSKISVKKGKKVKRGDKIGEAGTTGLSTGVHLHFEIRFGEKILNPSNYLDFQS